MSDAEASANDASTAPVAGSWWSQAGPDAARRSPPIRMPGASVAASGLSSCGAVTFSPIDR